MNKNLINSITEKISKINSTIPNINRGGCGIFAHALGAQFEKNGLKVNIVSVSVSVSSVERVQQNPNKIIKKLRDNNIDISPRNLFYCGDLSLSHMLVEVIDGNVSLYFDSNGKCDIINNKLNFCKTSGFIECRMSLEDCRIISEIEDGWNNTFDRASIPKVYEFVKKTINKVFMSKQLELNFGLSF